MKSGLTELVIITDKSGSMAGLEKDVVGGFNSLIKQQSEAEGDVLVTTVLFDNDINYLNKSVDIHDIKPMTEKDYVPSGCTALLDAVGGAIAYVKTRHMGLKEEDKPEHTIFSIMTDGYENASREYNYAKVKNMIESQQKEGWDFLFQAANIDVTAESAKLGILKENVACFYSNCESVTFACKMASNKILQKRSEPKDKNK